MKWKWRILAFITIFLIFVVFQLSGLLNDPISSIWLSFLSLIPYFIFINIILFFTCFKKKIFFLTTLLFLICGMYHHSRFIQLNPKISHNISFQSKLKVMSFNVDYLIYTIGHTMKKQSRK